MSFMTYLAEFRVRKTNEKIKISKKNPPYFLSEKSSKVEEGNFHEIFIEVDSRRSQLGMWNCLAI